MSSFSHHARRVIASDLPLLKRHNALLTCIRKACHGVNTHLIKCVHERLKVRFGFDAAGLARPEVLIACLALIEVERNMLLEAETVIIRRRIRQKMRGVRNITRKERALNEANLEKVRQRLQLLQPHS